jgi:pyridoxal phosphate enzyme (YggS family)
MFGFGTIICGMPSIVNMSNISDRLKQVKDNIAAACERADRNPKNVKVIIVTKTAPIEGIKEVLRAGFTEFGENRVQHLKQMASDIQQFLTENIDDESLPQEVKWHMIGHLQRNKVRPVLKISSMIHSVDTLRLAEEIDTASAKLGINVPVLLQVNCSGEPQKYGAPVGAATHLAEQMVTMPNITISGLMTMAPLTRDKNEVRACFVRARELFEEIQGNGHGGENFKHLSMGMSQDYEIAVEEGATILRIGSAIFS